MVPREYYWFIPKNALNHPNVSFAGISYNTNYKLIREFFFGE